MARIYREQCTFPKESEKRAYTCGPKCFVNVLTKVQIGMNGAKNIWRYRHHLIRWFIVLSFDASEHG